QKRVKRVPFVAAVQTDKSHHPQKVVLTQLSALSRDQLKNWGEKHLGSGVVVISKSLDYFHGIDSLCKHRSYELRKKNLASIEFELKWVRIVLVNVKAAFTGAIHAFDFRKYGHRYLGNMQFRFNHRFDLKNCFYEVLHCAVKAQAKPRRVLFSDIYG
ncbi:MAG: transposase, partial [Lentisphaeraceae bacterium]|nr:transposase [Lentisphaeraceae bacterium]